MASITLDTDIKTIQGEEKKEKEIIKCSMGITEDLEVVPCSSCKANNYLPVERNPNVDELCSACNKSLHHNSNTFSTIEFYTRKRVGDDVTNTDASRISINVLDWNDSYACPNPDKTCHRGSVNCGRCEFFKGEQNRTTLCSYNLNNRVYKAEPIIIDDPVYEDSNKSGIRRIDKIEFIEASTVNSPTDPTAMIVEKAPDLESDETIEVTKLVNGSWVTSIEVVNWKEKK